MRPELIRANIQITCGYRDVMYVYSYAVYPDIVLVCRLRIYPDMMRISRIGQCN
jgi:hypothetical protein